MINRIIFRLRRLANIVTDAASWLENKFYSVEPTSKFINLAPTDEADKDGVYSEALLFAITDPKVSNIALTGPYGSGKSSIIQSFLKKYRRNALHISLAAFVPESDEKNTCDSKVNRQEIERSILQQMLYGADANKLPLSRFKRIHSPGFWAAFKSLFIMIGILSLWFVIHERDEIVNGVFFSSLSPKLFILIYAAVFLWITLHHFYVASFGLSLKSISLKDVEIKPAQDDQTSILNRHLDEIIYFFQSTHYDLVIIEDLDRFDDADIFVTLREINRLVNENAGVKRIIRFLYALRDNMFVNTERTKFFEFIIPVIPIINSSNSIDMVLRQGNRLDLDGRLDRQFLREVSRYLNDLRLIQNIFNEYAIYVANLESDGENLHDANKLLAVLIYKNVYPSDFERLHRGEGVLAAILSRKDELIRSGEIAYREEVLHLENQLEIAERQTPSDLEELRKIYAMALIEKLPENASSISYNNQTWISIPRIANHPDFEQVIQTSRISFRPWNHYGGSQSFDASGWQSEISTQKSYMQRKKEIESKTADNKNRILRNIHSLRSKIAMLRTTKLNELLRLSIDRVQDLFERFPQNGELARFLILEGYLDDTYYQYTSLFHSGRLSPNDNKFLIQIRAFVTPEPSFPLDNPKEVIAAMRDEDFEQSYVLNINLVDCILSEPSQYSNQTKKLFQVLSSEFDSCEYFFDAYYTSGEKVAELLCGLAKVWKGLVPAFIESHNSTTHVTRLVASLPETLLEKFSINFNQLSEFVSVNLAGILTSLPEIAPKRLVRLNFEVKDLAAIKEYTEVVRFMFDEGLFELTISNLEFIYQNILGETNVELFRERNFTTIRSAHNETLLNRIERDFECYVRNILLKLEENSMEDASAILEVIRHDELNQDDIRLFLEQQTTKLQYLDEVPKSLYTMLFNLNAIEPNWVNCLSYLGSEGFEEDTLISYLEREDVRTAILQNPISPDTNSKPLRQFLYEASSLSDAAYREYTRALPRVFSYVPKELEPAKIRIIINERKVEFTKGNFDSLAEHSDLQVLFVVVNINDYFKDPDVLGLDDDFREELLRSDIDIGYKITLVEAMDLERIVHLPKRSALIGPIIDKAGIIIKNINSSIAKSLIAHAVSISVKVSLLNKYHSLMTVEEVRSVLLSLPKPYSEIKVGYSKPRLKNTPENRDLVEWLASRGIISTWTDLFSSDMIQVNLFRKL